MKKLILMMSVLLSCGLFCACSSDDDELNKGSGSTQQYNNEDPNATPDDINVLYIESDKGDAETCQLTQAICGSFGPTIKYPNYEDNSVREVYPIGLIAKIKNTSLFNDPIRPYTYLHIFIENSELTDINSLKVGDTFNSNVIRLMVINYNRNIDNDHWKIVCPIPEYRAGSGQILVVGKKTGDDGKTYLRLNLIDLKIYDKWDDLSTYTFNATVDYEIFDLSPDAPDMEKLVIPSERLVFFMMDAISNENQGNHTLFSEGPEEQECLIINSQEELEEVYKGHWETRYLEIPFEYCTLVIGRTYGEHGGVSLGDYELIDNGDTYQLNLTLNNNVNPNYTFVDTSTNLYFWKLYPKMENKPVAFTRVKKDVDIEPYDDNAGYTYLSSNWLLESYTEYIDNDRTIHEIGDGWGDERYSIEFKDNGIVEGHIGDKHFSGYYMLPYSYVVDGKSENWGGHYIYGAINQWDYDADVVNDEDPISKEMMRVLNEATVFKIWEYENKPYFMNFVFSDNQYINFYRKDVRKEYGFAR